MAIYVNRLHTYVHIQVHTGKQACTHAISTLPLLRMCHLHRRHEKSAGASKRSGIICNAFLCFQAQLNRLDVHTFRSGKNDRMFFLIPWNSPDPLITMSPLPIPHTTPYYPCLWTTRWPRLEWAMRVAVFKNIRRL